MVQTIEQINLTVNDLILMHLWDLDQLGKNISDLLQKSSTVSKEDSKVYIVRKVCNKQLKNGGSLTLQLNPYEKLQDNLKGKHSYMSVL